LIKQLAPRNQLPNVQVGHVRLCQDRQDQPLGRWSRI
jgi:hypothetical protein